MKKNLLKVLGLVMVLALTVTPVMADADADPRIAAADVAGLAGDLGCPAIQATRLGGQAERVQAQPVGPEREGLDEVRAGVEVLAVDRPDEVRAGRRQLVQAGALRDAAREQQRAHAAVRQERAIGEAGSEAGAGLAHDADSLAEGTAGPGRPGVWALASGALVVIGPSLMPKVSRTTSTPARTCTRWSRSSPGRSASRAPWRCRSGRP